MSDRPHRKTCDLAAPDLPPGASFEIPRPLNHRTWTDSDGVTWRRRGDTALGTAQARRLLSRPDARLMHVYLGEVHEHGEADRDSLIRDIEGFWSGAAHPMAFFEIGEFRDPDGRALAMIVEGC